MSRTLPDPKKGKDLYETMLAHSVESRVHILPSGIWSESTIEPTRERLIESEMTIGRQTRRVEDGKFVFDVTYPTREEATANVDLWLSRQALPTAHCGLVSPTDDTSVVTAHGSERVA